MFVGGIITGRAIYTILTTSLPEETSWYSSISLFILLDEALGRDGRGENERKVKGMKENVLFIGPSNRVIETTFATQKWTRGNSFGKWDRHN